MGLVVVIRRSPLHALHGLHQPMLRQVSPLQLLGDGTVVEHQDAGAQQVADVDEATITLRPRRTCSATRS